MKTTTTTTTTTAAATTTTQCRARCARCQTQCYTAHEGNAMQTHKMPQMRQVQSFLKHTLIKLTAPDFESGVEIALALHGVPAHLGLMALYSTIFAKQIPLRTLRLQMVLGSTTITSLATDVWESHISVRCLAGRLASRCHQDLPPRATR